MILTDFLLARIAEDEGAAKDTRWLAFEYGVDSFGQEAFAARVLADCESKRQIVAIVGRLGGHYEPNAAREKMGILRYLALPYASHEDYDESWRP